MTSLPLQCFLSFQHFSPMHFSSSRTHSKTVSLRWSTEKISTYIYLDVYTAITHKNSCHIRFRFSRSLMRIVYYMYLLFVRWFFCSMVQPGNALKKITLRTQNVIFFYFYSMTSLIGYICICIVLVVYMCTLFGLQFCTLYVADKEIIFFLNYSHCLGNTMTGDKTL